MCSTSPTGPSRTFKTSSASTSTMTVGTLRATARRTAFAAACDSQTATPRSKPSKRYGNFARRAASPPTFRTSKTRCAPPASGSPNASGAGRPSRRRPLRDSKNGVSIRPQLPPLPLVCSKSPPWTRKLAPRDRFIGWTPHRDGSRRPGRRVRAGRRETGSAPFSGRSDARITLSWLRRATSAPPQSPATGSRSRRTATTTGPCWRPTPGRRERTWVHTGLSAGVARYYRVSAINDDGAARRRRCSVGRRSRCLSRRIRGRPGPCRTGTTVRMATRPAP